MEDIKKYDQFGDPGIEINDMVELIINVGKYEKGTSGKVLRKYEETGSKHLLFFEILIDKDGTQHKQHVSGSQIKKLELK